MKYEKLTKKHGEYFCERNCRRAKIYAVFMPYLTKA